MGKINLNTPIIQPGELLHSFCTRFARVNSISDEELTDLLEINNICLGSLLESLEKIIKLTNLNKPAIEVMYDHTVVNLHRFGIPKDELKAYEKSLNNNMTIAYGFFAYPLENTICPLCALEDIEKFGYPLKRIYQNYNNVEVCYKHNTKLVYFTERNESNYEEYLKNSVEDNNNNEKLEYANFIYKLSQLKNSNICFENTEKVIVPYITKENYEKLAINAWDRNCLYSLLLKKVKLSGIDFSLFPRVLFLLYKDDFDLLQKRYDELNKDV